MIKPKIRFKGYQEEWEQRKFKELCDMVTVGIANSATHAYSDSGVVMFRNQNIKPNFLDDTDIIHINSEFEVKYKNKRLKKNDLLVARTGYPGTACVVPEKYENSQTFTTLIARPNENVDPYFLCQYLNSDIGIKYFESTQIGGGQKNSGAGILNEMPVTLPSTIEEEKQIADYFIQLDHLITLHHRKCEEMKILKKYMLQKMFPQNGNSVPEIRFLGFTEDWEQRKFSEMVTIERGGSPRPIDKFITNDKSGLNWVKIGDAPEQGNYITQTAEKIRPEGLSKTREVHPGDLILSNSMSFGRPYIMAIDGCIHDGWLAIRDTKKNFDLKFLCTLLGTDSMLNQYKAMAAGSTVNNLNKELVGGTIIAFPMLEEQIKIGDYFTSIDHLITLHQKKCDELRNIKKFMLQNMFI